MSDNTIRGASPHALPALPYPDNALDPVISANTIGFHYSKHHKGYVDNLNKLVAGGTPLQTVGGQRAAIRSHVRADGEVHVVMASGPCMSAHSCV
jgi:superoxide dismutase